MLLGGYQTKVHILGILVMSLLHTGMDSILTYVISNEGSTEVRNISIRAEGARNLSCGGIGTVLDLAAGTSKTCT